MGELIYKMAPSQFARMKLNYSPRYLTAQFINESISVHIKKVHDDSVRPSETQLHVVFATASGKSDYGDVILRVNNENDKRAVFGLRKVECLPSRTWRWAYSVDKLRNC